MYWIIKNEFILAILAAVIVGGYRRAAPHNNQSINCDDPNWVNCALGKRKCTNVTKCQFKSISKCKFNQSTNQSIIISNKSIKIEFNQSLRNASKSSINQWILSTFKFMKWMKLQNIGCTPPFVLGCAENEKTKIHRDEYGTVDQPEK